MMDSYRMQTNFEPNLITMKTLQNIALFFISSALLNLFWQCESRYSTEAQMIQRSYRGIPLSDGASGPESIAFDCEGKGPYVGVSDGRILKWESPNWIEFAYTCHNWTRQCSEAYDEGEMLCGRPLGMKFELKTCKLYIVDAYFGLMVVGRHGGRARSLAKAVDGVPFKFTNALDIDPHNRLIYFTDSSTHFQRWQFISIISSNDNTGRLMKYDIRTRSIEVLLTNLSFANGVALSKNKDFLLITETTIGQVRRYWLTGPRSGTSEMFIQLEACPDNINRNEDGDFWIAQVPPQLFFIPPFRGSGDRGSPVKVNEAGKVLELLDNTRSDNVITTSDVKQYGGRLWIGSVVDTYIEVTNY